MSAPCILAIDAASRFGFAVGTAGSKPYSSSRTFAKSTSASHGAIFSGALKWTAAAIKEYEPDLIVIEAPLPGSFVQGKSNANTAKILTGLPACIEGMAYLLGVFNVEHALLSSVRAHL